MTITRFAFVPKESMRSPLMGYELHTHAGKPQKLDIHVLDVARIHSPFQIAVPAVLRTALDVNARLAVTEEENRRIFREYPTFWIKKPRPSLCLSFSLAKDGQPVRTQLTREAFCPDAVLQENELSHSIRTNSNIARCTVSALLHQWHPDAVEGGKKEKSCRSKAHALHMISESIFNQAAAHVLNLNDVSALYAVPRDDLTCPIPTLIKPQGMIHGVWMAQSGNPSVYIPHLYDGVTRKGDVRTNCANPLSGYDQFINNTQLSCAVSGQVSPFNQPFIEVAAAAENDLYIQRQSPSLREKLDQKRRAAGKALRQDGVPMAGPGLA